MPGAMILQLNDDQLEISASLTTYTEMVTAQGFPATHLQLLQELKAWLDRQEAFRADPVQAMQDVLDFEAQFLTDAGVAGVASEHLAFLYTVVAEVFDEVDADFQHIMQHEAQLVEQTQEDAISQHMRETGCDRLEAVQYMKGAALEHLQERQDRIMHLLRLLMDDAAQG